MGHGGRRKDGKCEQEVRRLKNLEDIFSGLKELPRELGRKMIADDFGNR